MTVPIRLNHRFSPTPESGGSPIHSSRPTLPQILTTSASNAVHIRRSTAPTSRRVRTHWFNHFVASWRRSSRASKLLLIGSPTLVTIQILSSAIVLKYTWDMTCDQPLRMFLTYYMIQLALSSILHAYLFLRSYRPNANVNIPARAEQGDGDIQYLLSTNERTTILFLDRAKTGLDVFGFLWFLVGNYMIFASTTCYMTAPPLYYMSVVTVVYGYLMAAAPILLCASVIFCLPCVLVVMRLLHVGDETQMGGASREEIAKIPLYAFRATKPGHTKTPYQPPSTRLDFIGTSVTSPEMRSFQTDLDSPPYQQDGWLKRLWNPLVFADTPTGAEPPLETMEIPNEQDQLCVICLSTYEDNDILCKLWCDHHFHKACVHEWLALNSRCPMCKRDSRGLPGEDIV